MDTFERSSTGSGILVIVLRARPAGSKSTEEAVARAEEAWGLELHPLLPGGSDRDAERYYFASAAGIEDPDQKAQAIARSADVEAAYFKPPDEPPVIRRGEGGKS